MQTKKISILIMSILMYSASSYALTSLTIPIHLVATNGVGKEIGTITFQDADCGVLLTPRLHDLPPGMHGFHIHQNPSCADNGMAAGGHLDPQHSDAHRGPYAHHGHEGDLPVLMVQQDGTATTPTLAPRFKLAAIMNHAIMIHAGGDNYADQPEKLGGGGARIACGIIKKST